MEKETKTSPNTSPTKNSTFSHPPPPPAFPNYSCKKLNKNKCLTEGANAISFRILKNIKFYLFSSPDGKSCKE